MSEHSTRRVNKAARPVEFRDGSRRNFVMVPNHVVRGGHKPNMLAVLFVIASHAGENGVCFASAEKIGEEAGVKRATVYNAVRYWERCGHLRTDRKSGFLTSVVTTFDFTATSAPRGTPTCAPPGTPPVPTGAHLPVPREAHKEEPIKKTHEEDVAARGAADVDQQDIVDVLDAFRTGGLNPHINFGNITQRKAAAELLKAYGRSKVLATVAYAASISGKPYAPTITTPLALKQDLGKLIAYSKREEAKKPSFSFIS